MSTEPFAPPLYEDARSQKPSRRRLWVVLGVVAAVLLAGGGTVAVLAVRAVEKFGAYKLAPPLHFQGLTDNTTTAVAQLDLTNERKAAGPGYTPVVALYYPDSSSAEGRQFLLHGQYGDFLHPDQDLARSWANMLGATPGSRLVGMTTSRGGPLGGVVQCAAFTSSQYWNVPICVWSDNSSLVVLEFQGEGSFKPIHPDLAALLQRTVVLRALTEIRK